MPLYFFRNSTPEVGPPDIVVMARFPRALPSSIAVIEGGAVGLHVATLIDHIINHIYVIVAIDEKMYVFIKTGVCRE
jgi:hypothetical protein